MALPGPTANTPWTDYIVKGTSFDPRSGAVLGLPPTLDASLAALCSIAAVCNDAKVEWGSGVEYSLKAVSDALM